MTSIRVGILTVSDRCSRGEASDESGANLEKSIANGSEGWSVSHRKCVADEKEQIKVPTTFFVVWLLKIF